jgi:hypothetical protein
VGIDTAQYQAGANVANDVISTYGSASLSIAGYSKGGGIGAFAGMATHIPSRTFNAAGSFDPTGSMRTDSRGLVHNYYVWGEVLSGTQEFVGFNRALGSQTIINPADGKSGLFGDAAASLGRHDLDSVIAGLQQKLLDDCY